MKVKTIPSFLVFTFSMCLFNNIKAQQKQNLFGTVSFVTSQNVYLKFENTESINAGDTVSVKINDQHMPCLIILQKSSLSCVAGIIDDCTVEQGTEVVVRTKTKKPGKEKKRKTKPLAEVSADTSEASTQDKNLEKFKKVNANHYRGRSIKFV